MKTMKLSMLAIILLLSAAFVNGQEYKIQVQNVKEGKLVLKNFPGDLPVEGYSGTEIIISSSATDRVTPERAKGLKPIYPGGTDNTGLGLDVQKNGSQVSVVCLLPITRREDYKIKVPDNLAIDIESGCERASAITVSNMKNEIDIKNCQNINLKGVSGPLVLSTISGEINVTFSNISLSSPFSISSISGEIDVTLPAKSPVNLVMGTISGGLYSDFEFPKTEKNLKKVGGNELKYSLNGGGVKFTLATVSGNIYLRKGQ
jgi:lia operon protein LiaG